MYTTGTDLDLRPTQETYDAFQEAYERFNWELFDGTLPNSLITLQRKCRSYGYFSPKRFGRQDGAKCDEIALNPTFFRLRPLQETLSTLVHEQVHLWQHYFGSPGRGRYHNREWADKMKAVGLHPSSTGKSGGAETGDRMSHYVIKDGAFALSAQELIAGGFRIEWHETPAASQTPLLAPRGTSLSEPADPDRQSAKGGQRTRYTCSACGLNAWSRAGAHLVCGDHMRRMETEPQ